ncbi:hypothetical protein Gotri_025624, partial [Gossypium trilobum]|nr:hypothetical protein [Gossypium trilobum]
MKDVIRLSNRLNGKPVKEAQDLRRNLFPTPFSFFVGSTFEGAPKEQQALLELEDTAARLRREKGTLRNTLNYLSAASAVKDAVNDNDIHNIIMSYLVHNCFKETVESFIACTGMKQPSDYLEDMEKRKSSLDEMLKNLLEFCAGIYQFALEGNALKAIELTEQLATNLLEKNKDLHFDLLSLHFVELVCSRKCTEALEFAQMKLTPFGKEQKYVEKLEVCKLSKFSRFQSMCRIFKDMLLLQDFMALLAYEEPEKSPMFHLLSLEYRQHVAESLNRAILAHGNHPTYTAMERLIQQTTVVRQCLNQEHAK